MANCFSLIDLIQVGAVSMSGCYQSRESGRLALCCKASSPSSGGLSHLTDSGLLTSRTRRARLRFTCSLSQGSATGYKFLSWADLNLPGHEVVASCFTARVKT